MLRRKTGSLFTKAEAKGGTDMEEILVLLKVEELTREHPRLKPIHDKALKELEEKADEMEKKAKLAAAPPEPPPAPKDNHGGVKIGR